MCIVLSLHDHETAIGANSFSPLRHHQAADMTHALSAIHRRRRFNTTLLLSQYLQPGFSSRVNVAIFASLAPCHRTLPFVYHLFSALGHKIAVSGPGEQVSHYTLRVGHGACLPCHDFTCAGAYPSIYLSFH